MVFFRFQTGLLAIIAGVCAPPTLAESENAVRIEELRGTISGIVELQSQASRELREWQARRDVMVELMELHRQEIKLLDEELGESGRSAPGHAEAVESANREIARLRQVRFEMVDAIERLRPRVVALTARFPRPAHDEIESELGTLSSWSRGNEPRDAMQAMLAILSKASQFNRRISRSHEVVDSREVEVVYLGLARAYYADRSGVAGIGTPGVAGWEWRPDPALNRRILRAFDILNQKQPPARIDLPLDIE